MPFEDVKTSWKNEGGGGGGGGGSIYYTPTLVDTHARTHTHI